MALQGRGRDLLARVLDDDGGALSGALTADDIRGLFAWVRPGRPAADSG
jgi:hypothetical protein